jgi:hypothetical protein
VLGVSDALVTAAVLFQNPEIRATPKPGAIPFRVFVVVFFAVSNGSRMSMTEAPKMLEPAVELVAQPDHIALVEVPAVDVTLEPVPLSQCLA